MIFISLPSQVSDNHAILLFRSFDTKTARKIVGSSIVTVTTEHRERNAQNFEAGLDGFTFTI